MLGAVNHKVQHIKATPWQDIPSLYAKLDPATSGGLCLRWMILTLVRSHGCRAACVSEVSGDVWTVPRDRIKGTVANASDFRVPLSAAALDIAGSGVSDMLFPGRTGKAPISDRALELHLDRIEEVGRPHGFRTSFRTWVQDTDACGFDVAEAILGHSLGSKVVRSYARSDLLERRRPVMEAWARYVSNDARNVVRISG